MTISIGTVVAGAQYTYPSDTSFNVTCSGSNRAIAVHILSYGNNPVTAITINGNTPSSFTAFLEVEGNWSGVFYLTGSGVANGTNAVVFTPTAVGVYTHYQAVPIIGDSGALSLSGNTNASDYNAAPTWTVSSATSDLVIAPWWTSNLSTTVSVSSPGVEDSRINTRDFSNMFCWHEAGASSVTLDGTSSGSMIWSGTGFSVHEASGGTVALGGSASTSAQTAPSSTVSIGL